MRILTSSSLLFLLLASSCASVGPGQVGVLWTAANGTQPHLYGEGLHPVASWNKMYVYDARSLTRDEPLAVLASNGLGIKLGTTVRYHIVPNDAVAIQEEVGPQYYDKIVRPLLGSEGRRIISQYTPEEIYTSKRPAIESELATAMRNRLVDRHIVIEGIQLRDVELPVALRAAIDQKAVAEQKSLSLKYELAGARVEAEKKNIEAQGLAEYNRTIRGSLTHEILEYERLQQLGKIASSPNAKDVVVGAGGGAPTPLVVTGSK